MGKDLPPVPIFVELTTYLGYVVQLFFGLLRDLIGRGSGFSRYKDQLGTGRGADKAPLTSGWGAFYTRRLYHRLQDVFNRPISSRPGSYIDVMERVSADNMKTMTVTCPPKTQRLMNLGSYNYLGFGDDWSVSCSEAVLAALEDMPVSLASSRVDFGTSRVHAELEKEVAAYLGKEAALVFNMGFGTNATVIPTLVGAGDLILSDGNNHNSIITGCRCSGAFIRPFAHNDADALEMILRESIAIGQPRTRRRWRKILVVVEGIYSMEGSICDLANITRVAKKYGAYIYLDEAHSIGALGSTGRGVTEHCGVDTAKVDVMMGTFTKSFSGMGGYIAGSKAMIDGVRKSCSALLFHNSMSPVVAAQVLQAFRVILGKDPKKPALGRQKIEALKRNSNFLRTGLAAMGLSVLGDRDSPIIPIMLYNPSKIAAFSRECKRRGLAMVVVGFPATGVIASRARICCSAAHTQEDMHHALEVIDEVSRLLLLRYEVSSTG